MRTVIIALGIVFIFVFLGVALYHATGNEGEFISSCSSEEWVRQFMATARVHRNDYISTELVFISSESDEKTTKEFWEYKYKFEDGYELWDIVIKFKAQYNRDAVPNSAIIHLLGNANPFIKS